VTPPEAEKYKENKCEGNGKRGRYTALRCWCVVDSFKMVTDAGIIQVFNAVAARTTTFTAPRPFHSLNFIHP
jgi:hypothetical protein